MVGRRRNSSLFRAASSMSSFDRRTFLICAVALTGCGFTPAYAPGETAHALRGHVLVDAPDDRESYNLANTLNTGFGRVTTPLYRLSYEVRTRENAIGITRDQEITRYHVVGTVSYQLTEIDTGATVISDEVQSFTAYSAPTSPVDRLTASRDAYERLMTILGDQIVSQIITTVDP